MRKYNRYNTNTPPPIHIIIWANLTSYDTHLTDRNLQVEEIGKKSI